MLEIETLVCHGLGQADAMDRMHQMVDSLPERFPQQVHQVRSAWEDNMLHIRFATYGYIVQWKATVKADQVELVGQIPDAASPYKSKIEQVIVSRLETVLTSDDKNRALKAANSY